ncbi:MAG TPA: DUF3613 domain-containing protein [Nevskia sp.]|nr:DUF3613 domain-containing protein [Nevskia sp.]
MRGWMIVASCTLPFAALAQPESTVAPADSSSPAPAAAAPAASAPAAGQGFGSQTRYWLATQTSGAYAVTDPRPMSGEAATLVYQRYLNSFTHPIPERYSSDSFTTSGGGTGSGSAR